MAIRSARDDAGFTLVELMASITILAVGIVGVIGVMNSSFRVAGATSSRSKGVAVATKHVERLRATPYKLLATSTVAGQYKVETDTVGGREFTVKTAVTLEDEATLYPGQTTKATGAYKKAYVWVSWVDEAGVHDVHQTTLIYPGGLGLHDVAKTVKSTGVVGKPLAPLSLAATPVTTGGAVDLVWVPPAPSLTAPEPATYVVQYSQDPTFPPTSVQQVAASLPSTVTILRVSDLAGGTTYHFRVFSKSGDGSLSTTAAQALNVTTIASLSTVCAVGTASVTPSAIVKRSGNDGSGLTPSPQVQINTSGLCTGITFSMSYSPRKDGTVDTRALPLTSTGTYAAAVDGNQGWIIGEHDIVVSSTQSGVTTSRATLRLIVCDHQKKVCP